MKLIFVIGIASFVYRVSGQSPWPFFNLGPIAQPGMNPSFQAPVVSFNGLDLLASNIANTFANSILSMIWGRGGAPNMMPANMAGAQSASAFQPAAAAQNPWNIPAFSSGFQNIVPPLASYGPSAPGPSAPAGPMTLISKGPLIPVSKIPMKPQFTGPSASSTSSPLPPATSGPPAPASSIPSAPAPSEHPAPASSIPSVPVPNGLLEPSLSIPSVSALSGLPVPASPSATAPSGSPATASSGSVATAPIPTGTFPPPLSALIPASNGMPTLAANSQATDSGAGGEVRNGTQIAPTLNSASASNSTVPINDDDVF